MCFLLETTQTIYGRTNFGRNFSYHKQIHTQTHKRTHSISQSAVSKWTNESNRSIANLISHHGSMAINVNLLSTHKSCDVVFSGFMLFYPHFARYRIIRKRFLCRQPFDSVQFHSIPLLLPQITATPLSFPFLHFHQLCFMPISIWQKTKFDEWTLFFDGVRGTSYTCL